MNDKAFYEQILGLRAPWRVAGVALSLEAGEVVVRVEAEETDWGCPECGERMSVHGWVSRR